MSNFDFLRSALPALYPGAARAESYVVSDPVAACFYARRVAEELVGYLYELLDLPAPYSDDLAARVNAREFQAVTGTGINRKFNLIRTYGNKAAHPERAPQIRADVSQQVLRELHHVLIWAARHHSASPDSVPTKTQFDASFAQQAAPVPRAEVVRIAEQYKLQDEARARQLAERDEVVAAQDAQIAVLRAQVATAQAAATKADDHDYGEAQTRDLFLDVLLGEAGWPLAKAEDREYPVTGMPTPSGRGFVDYVLWGADGRPLAVIEAKRTRKSPEAGRQQAALYADRLAAQFGRRPVVFYTNGYEHWLWDDAAGYPPREVAGFLTADELELMIQRRDTRQSLATAEVSRSIVGRPYQVQAIRAIDEAFDARARDALLVMATGSGKTRTVIALVDQLMKAGWVKRVLFLADRTALVNQAVAAFKTHLPAATTVNLVTERNADGRVYVSTYPTIVNLINDVDGTQRRFGPGFFDLVVLDEAHRSVYGKYGVIFDWFDTLLVGLTATPKDEVDHNTYRLFHLEDGVPTDNYTLAEAVEQNFLVPPRGVAVGTRFLRHGIHYRDLTEQEKDQWDSLDWGEGDPPDEVGAEELNRFLFNEDTVDKVLATLMTQGHKVAGGDRLGKTIIFAKSQRHAEFIDARFNLGWPEHAGHFARVVTHATPYAQTLIDDFSTTDKAPHIAISVDMLDTGIDVPDVVNLVFFKVVHSSSKFWQMIGRGTRLRPDLYGPGEHKTDFLVFDFCGNLEYFNQNLPPAESPNQRSLTERLFASRLALVTELDRAGAHPDLRASTAAWLHQHVAGMSLDNVVVRPHRRAVERFAQGESWAALNADDAQAAIRLAGLPSGLRDNDEEAKRFDLLMLRRQLAQLESDAVTAEAVRESVQAIASALLTRTTIPSVAEQAVLLESVAGDDWWVDVTLPMLELARLRIRGLVRFIERSSRNPIYTDFADTLDDARDVTLPRAAPGTDVARFRAKTAAFLREHQEHVSLQRLRRNRQLTTDDLSALEEMLLANGVGQVDLASASERAGGLGLFIRSIVGLERGAAAEAFSGYLDGTRFNVDQIRFVDLIINELTHNGVVDPGRLFEPPYTDHAATGPDVFFQDAEVAGIVGILDDIRDHAVPQAAVS